MLDFETSEPGFCRVWGRAGLVFEWVWGCVWTCLLLCIWLCSFLRPHFVSLVISDRCSFFRFGAVRKPHPFFYTHFAVFWNWNIAALLSIFLAPYMWSHCVLIAAVTHARCPSTALLFSPFRCGGLCAAHPPPPVGRAVRARH